MTPVNSTADVPKYLRTTDRSLTSNCRINFVAKQVEAAVPRGPRQMIKCIILPRVSTCWPPARKVRDRPGPLAQPEAQANN